MEWIIIFNQGRIWNPKCLWVISGRKALVKLRSSSPSKVYKIAPRHTPGAPQFVPLHDHKTPARGFAAYSKACFTVAREEGKYLLSPPFTVLIGSPKSVHFSDCFWWPFRLSESRCCLWSLSVTVALFPFDLSFLNPRVRQLQVQCNIHERLIYAGTRLCSRITGYWMLYAALISFYDQRTQPEFLKYGIYESLIHAGFKGPLSLCPAQMGRWGEQFEQPLPVNETT